MHACMHACMPVFGGYVTSASLHGNELIYGHLFISFHGYQQNYMYFKSYTHFHKCGIFVRKGSRTVKKTLTRNKGASSASKAPPTPAVPSTLSQTEKRNIYSG